MRMTVVMSGPAWWQGKSACSNEHVSISRTTRSLHRIYLYNYWTFASLAFVVVFIAFSGLAASDYSDVAIAAAASFAVVTAVCAGVSYVLFLRREPRQRQYRWWSVAVVGLACGLGVGVWRGHVDYDWLVQLVFVAVGPMLWARVGWRIYTTLGLAVVSAGLMYGLWQLGMTHAAAAPVAAIVIPFGLWSMWVQWWQYDVAVQLEEARQVASQLAIADERLRFASELHDIQGHHLQAITLKAELAARVAEADGKAEAGEFRELEQLARHALRDTREVVTGYRKVSLGSEIDNAAQLFRAVGIGVTVSGAAEASDPSEGLLGYLVREAATNILRHSQATWVSIECATTGPKVRVSVTNDGAGEGPVVPGNGLSMLAERLSGAGGSFAWELREDQMQVTGYVGGTEVTA